MYENCSKCRSLTFRFWYFPSIFVLSKVTCLVTLFQKLAKIDHFWHFWWTFVHSKWKNCSQYWMRLFLWFSNTVEPQSSGISFHSSSGWWPKFKVWIFHLFPGWQGANGTPCWLFHASPEAVLIYGPQWRQLPPKLRGQNDFAFASSQQWLQTTCQIQSYVRSRRIALWEAGAK